MSNIKQIVYSDSSSDEECGIYGRKLQQTKTEIVKSHKESDLLEAKNLKKKYIDDTDTANSECNNTQDDDDNDENKENDSCEDDSDVQSDESNQEPKIKSKRKDDRLSSTPPSPPSPPSASILENKRKSNKALKDLEFLTQQARMLKKTDESLNESGELLNESDMDNFITIRVITKNGVKKFDYKKDEKFKRLFEEVSHMEKCNVENLVLMFNEKKLTFSETPNSINYVVGDLIECGKSLKKIQERIKIVEGSEEEEGSENQVVITLQGEEGRKSRVRLLVYKDEKFKAILEKYCQKRELNSVGYIMEFDGDHVSPNETPTDLDIEGGEIFDVKKSSKPTMEHVKQNQRNYDFDDEVLCV